jgi:hypothetical protein
MAAPAAAPTRIPVEYRFPLHLEPSVETVWGLYNDAKRGVWDPATAIPWEAPVAASAADREAARLVWSHRAWLAYGRLSEGPALLVRFCLERQRESDPKYMLSVRGSEDAWYVDAAQRLAARFGGFIAAPADAAYGERFNLALHRQVFSADESLDAQVAALVLDRDGLDAALLAAAARHARDAAVREALALVRRDRERQARFGALYLAGRARLWSADDRAAVAAAVARGRAQFVAAGLLHPATGGAPADLIDAHERAAAAGLGGIARGEAQDVVASWTREADACLRALGVS